LVLILHVLPEPRIELVGLPDAVYKYGIEIVEGFVKVFIGQPEPEGRRTPARNQPVVMKCRFGTLLEIDRVSMTVDNIFLDAVLEISSSCFGAIQPLQVGLIVAKKIILRFVRVEIPFSEIPMLQHDMPFIGGHHPWFVFIGAPAPGISEPDGRKDMHGRRILSPVMNGYPDEDILHIRLGIFDKNVEIAVLVEDTRVYQLELRLLPRPSSVFINQPLIGKSLMRILVEHLHVAVGGRGVQVVLQFLYVFAMIAFIAGETEQ